MAVTSDRITWRHGHGITDASDLGWRPGHWPPSFAITSKRTGEEIEFRRRNVFTHRGEFAGYVYKPVTGADCLVRVVND